MRIIPIFIPHLGCPHDCVFCNQRRIAAPIVPTAEDVRQEIEKALEYTENPQIAFYGGSFTAIGEELMEEYLSAAYEFIEKGLCSSIRVSTRPDCIDEKILTLLKSYKVTHIELGVQSMDEDVLKASKRGHTAEDVIQSVYLIKSFGGFSLGLQMMAGLPLDSEEKTIATALKIRDLAPDFVRIYPVCVIENTELADMMMCGSYTPLAVDKAVDICAKLCVIFEEAGIEIIRIGLNPTDELSGGAVLGGAYHPALGEMVRGKMLENAVINALSKVKEKNVTVVINPKDISKLKGRGGAALKNIRAAFVDKSVSVDTSDKISRDSFEIDVDISR